MPAHANRQPRSFIRNAAFLEYGYALTLIALALVLCVPFQGAPANASAGVWQICTPDGVRDIRVDTTGEGDGQAPDDPARHCPLCYTRQQQAAVIAADTTFTPPVFIPVRLVRVTGAAHVPSMRHMRPYRQRAPPFSRV